MMPDNKLRITAEYKGERFEGELTATEPTPDPESVPIRFTAWDQLFTNWRDHNDIEEKLRFCSQHKMDLQVFMDQGNVWSTVTTGHAGMGLVRLVSHARALGVDIDVRMDTRTMPLDAFEALVETCAAEDAFPRTFVADSEWPQEQDYYHPYREIIGAVSRKNLPSVISLSSSAFPERRDAEYTTGDMINASGPSRIWFRASGGDGGATRRTLGIPAFIARLERCYRYRYFTHAPPLYMGAQRWNRTTGKPETIENIAKGLAVGLLGAGQYFTGGLHWGETDLRRNGYGELYGFDQIREAYDEVLRIYAPYRDKEPAQPELLVIRDPASRLRGAQLLAFYHMVARSGVLYDVVSPMWYTAEHLRDKSREYRAVLVEGWTEDLIERWEAAYGYILYDALAGMSVIAPERDKNESFADTPDHILPSGRIGERHPTFAFAHEGDEYWQNMDRILFGLSDILSSLGLRRILCPSWAVQRYTDGTALYVPAREGKAALKGGVR